MQWESDTNFPCTITEATLCWDQVLQVMELLNPGAHGWDCAEDGYQAPHTWSVQWSQGCKLLLTKGGNSDSWGTTRVRLKLLQLRHSWFKKHIQGFGDPTAVPCIAQFWTCIFCAPSMYSNQWQFRGWLSVVGLHNLTLLQFPYFPSHSALKQKHHSSKIFPQIECLRFRL